MKIVNIVTLWENPTKIVLKNPISGFAADAFKSDKKCLLAFTSGKIIATGFKSMKDITKVVGERYPQAKMIKIVNMTATVTMRTKKI